MSAVRILVPRLLDSSNVNAQNLNAKALLARVASADVHWSAVHYDAPDPEVLANPRVSSTKLWRRHLWLLRLWLFYLEPAQGLFYPGREAVDAAGVRWRKRLYPQRPICATLEGLAGTAEREQQLTAWAGHQVYCHRIDGPTMQRVDGILAAADHIVALSPFLAAMGKRLYGDKCSVLPLGIDTGVFHPPAQRANLRMQVVSAGRLAEHKRPEVFVELAARHPEADFTWYGEGALRTSLQGTAQARQLGNLQFPGALQPAALAAAFRGADVFVMPSLSEGVPKVTQEAAACGLPAVVFGHYEAPSVADGRNGYVVWSDAGFYDKVAALLRNPALAATLGAEGAKLALGWDWNTLAPLWEKLVRERLGARNP